MAWDVTVTGYSSFFMRCLVHALFSDGTDRRALCMQILFFNWHIAPLAAYSSYISTYQLVAVFYDLLFRHYATLRYDCLLTYAFDSVL